MLGVLLLLAFAPGLRSGLAIVFRALFVSRLPALPRCRSGYAFAVSRRCVDFPRAGRITCEVSGPAELPFAWAASVEFHLTRRQSMQHEQYRPVEAPYAWKGADMQRSTEWLRPFKPDELAEIDSALQSAKTSGLDLFDMEREHFPLPTFSKALAKLADELENGRGMVMLRGLPLSYSPEDLQIVYWGIGAHLGTAVSQNKDGELFGIVKDFRENRDDTRKRGSKSNDGLDFHSDRCDVVGLLCVRKAKSGGVSRIVSSAAIHNEVLRRRPDLMDVFYDPELCHSWQGEEPPGYPRYYKRPVFGYRDGHFTGMFSPLYTRSAQQYPEVPRLTDRQREALAVFAALADELALEMHFEPGDIQLLNNHVIYHARTHFEDFEEESRKRLLLRLWLSVPGNRPLPQGYEIIYGANEAGAVRGGVPCREGLWRDVTQFRKNRTGIHTKVKAHEML
jgi:hypothetical protein